MKIFSQNLIDREGEVEKEMLAFYSGQEDRFERVPSTIFERMDLSFILKLHYLRSSLGQSRDLSGEFDFVLFYDIMKKARDLANEAGATLVFINIPTLSQAYIADSDPIGRATIEVINELGIKWLDLGDVIVAHEDPSSLYAFRQYGGHFSNKGNDQVADFVFDNVLRQSDMSRR